MNRIIYAKTESGVDGFMKVMTTLRKKTFDIQDATMMTVSSQSDLRFVIREKADLTAEVAVGHLRQLHDIFDVQLV